MSTINAGVGEESPPSQSVLAWSGDQESEYGERRPESLYRAHRSAPRRSDETDRTGRSGVTESSGRDSGDEREREIRLDTDEDFSGGSYGHDADPVAVLEQHLASAAKAREERASMDADREGSVEMERKKSLTERFKDTLRGGR